MDDIRVVIVDDSPFTVAIIKEVIEHHGYKVVGHAGSLEEVKEVVKSTKPNLVTMDLSLPGTDGFECTRAIYEIDPSIKVIVISSMKDDEFVDYAINHRISAYLQKPIDGAELIDAIKRIVSHDDIYNTLQEEYFEVFKESLNSSIGKMTQSSVTFGDDWIAEKEYTSDGIVIVVGIVGKFTGKMLISLSKDTSELLATAILKRKPRSDYEMSYVCMEFANIVSGNACSVLNTKNKEYSLRVAPPSIMIGDNINITPPDFITRTTKIDTDFGKLTLNAGFKRGN